MPMVSLRDSGHCSFKWYGTGTNLPHLVIVEQKFVFLE
jgi:hypothetical protein